MRNRLLSTPSASLLALSRVTSNVSNDRKRFEFDCADGRTVCVYLPFLIGRQYHPRHGFDDGDLSLYVTKRYTKSSDLFLSS